MKVLWVSNAPWCGTGYGVQTQLVAQRLKDDGHDVAIAVNYGLQGAAQRWRGIQILPMGYDQFSNDIIPSHAEKHLGGEPGDGWVITLFDVWAFRNPRFQRFNLACWVPIDHLPVPPMVAGFLRESFARPIAMSKFGQRQLEVAGLEAMYAPHGVDTNIFKPGDKALARDVLGLSADAFIVTMNAANKGADIIRKSFFEVFAAVSQLRQEHSDVFLYVHADQYPPGGVKLTEVAAAVGLTDDTIAFAEPYAYRLGYPPEVMSLVYAASDVLAAPSRGEGFGVPVIEAQACGVPVIVSNFSAQPELVGDGWLAEGEAEWHAPQSSAFFKPYAWSILDGLRAAYDNRTDEPNAKCLAKAAEYDADLVHDRYWRPIMKELESRTPTLEPIKATPA